MADKTPIQKDRTTLCRIKVNKMISSINSNTNIFIPKYTMTNRNESKYFSHLNKVKQTSINSTHNKIKNMKSINKKGNKNSSNRVNMVANESNYTTQPVDFIIDHGVLVYQRNFKGEEIINFGGTNDYLRNNKFNMAKNDKSISQTYSNFKKNHSKSTLITNIDSLSRHKKIKMKNSKEKLISMSDMYRTKKNKIISSRQHRLFSTNLNTSQNSFNSLNAISVKNYLLSTKNKALNNNFTYNNNKPTINMEIKNAKKIINYVRKKKNNNNDTNFYNSLMFENKKNSETFSGNEENQVLNSTYAIRNIHDNNRLKNIFDKKYNTIYSNDYKINVENKYYKINKKLNDKINIKQKDTKRIELEKKKICLLKFVNIFTKHYLGKYFVLLRNILSKNIINNKIENEKKTNNNINKLKDKKTNGMKNKRNKVKIDMAIVKKNILTEKILNSFEIPDHKKSNSIIVNRKMSSNISTTIDNQKNNSKNNNLSFLISKNLRFFSKDREYNKETRESELFRDSQSLQKKYEEICRRKKRDLTLTLTSRFKECNSIIENNYLSDINKTNSFSNFNDNISVNSLKIVENMRKFNHVYYKDNNSLSSRNNNEHNNDNDNDNNNNNGNSNNLVENEKNKNLYKIKLIRGKNKDKQLLNYRIGKNVAKNTSKDKSNKNYQIFSETKNSKFINRDNDIYIHNNRLSKMKSFNANMKNKLFNNCLVDKNDSNNNKINKNIINPDKKNNYLEERNILNKNGIYSKKGKINKKNKIKFTKHLIKNISTKDKRVFIYITYIPQILKSKNIDNKYKYDNNLLKITNLMNYTYYGILQKNKSLIRRINDYEKKLSLIREEDEKSKYLNSTNSIRVIDESILYSNKKNDKNIRPAKDKKSHDIKVTNILKLLKKIFYNKCIIYKIKFIFILKIIYFISLFKKIIFKNIKNTYFLKLLENLKKYQKNKKNNKNKKIYYRKIKMPKMEKGIRKSNIYKNDKKKYLNNIIINDENIFTANSFDIYKEFNFIESPIRKQRIIYRNKDGEKSEISEFLSKTEKKNFYNLYKDI